MRAPTTVCELERAAIVGAVAATGGNPPDGRRLGIGLRTLYEKLKSYDLG